MTGNLSRRHLEFSKNSKLENLKPFLIDESLKLNIPEQKFTDRSRGTFFSESARLYTEERLKKKKKSEKILPDLSLLGQKKATSPSQTQRKKVVLPKYGVPNSQRTDRASLKQKPTLEISRSVQLVNLKDKIDKESHHLLTTAFTQIPFKQMRLLTEEIIKPHTSRTDRNAKSRNSLIIRPLKNNQRRNSKKISKKSVMINNSDSKYQALKILNLSSANYAKNGVNFESNLQKFQKIQENSSLIKEMVNDPSNIGHFQIMKRQISNFFQLKGDKAKDCFIDLLDKGYEKEIMKKVLIHCFTYDDPDQNMGYMVQPPPLVYPMMKDKVSLKKRENQNFRINVQKKLKEAIDVTKKFREEVKIAKEIEPERILFDPSNLIQRLSKKREDTQNSGPSPSMQDYKASPHQYHASSIHGLSHISRVSDYGGGASNVKSMAFFNTPSRIAEEEGQEGVSYPKISHPNLMNTPSIVYPGNENGDQQYQYKQGGATEQKNPDFGAKILEEAESGEGIYLDNNESCLQEEREFQTGNLSRSHTNQVSQIEDSQTGGVVRMDSIQNSQPKRDKSKQIMKYLKKQRRKSKILHNISNAKVYAETSNLRKVHIKSKQSERGKLAKIRKKTHLKTYQEKLMTKIDERSQKLEKGQKNKVIQRKMKKVNHAILSSFCTVLFAYQMRRMMLLSKLLKF